MNNTTKTFSCFDLLITNAHIHCMDEAHTVYKQGVIGVIGDSIAWIGEATQDIPSKYTIDAKGMLVTPGLIDCHTHVVYTGNRSQEFAMRLQGKSYQKIAKEGGGILATVNAVHKSSEEIIYQESKSRILDMMRYGTTTIESKSGYGLDLDNELKLLKVMQKLALDLPLRIYQTYLGLHALPNEYANNSDDYVDWVIDTILPEIVNQSLAYGVDAFCESIAFTPKQVERFFKAAKSYGLELRLHAEQLSHQGGAKLAAQMGALSADHLEYMTSQDVNTLAKSNTVAVLLPGAFYSLHETKKPPINSLRQHKVAMAIATDCNPGTSPFVSLPLMMNMACMLFGLTIEEAWLGVTRHAAKALRHNHQIGELTPGFKADIVLWNCYHLADVVYQPSNLLCKQIIIDGQIIY